MNWKLFANLDRAITDSSFSGSMFTRESMEWKLGTSNSQYPPQ
jgi:hypothetical protein